MQTVLEHVAKKLKFDLPEEASQQIAEDSGGNMRKALLVFEALKMQSYVQLGIAITATHHVQARPFGFIEHSQTRLGNVLPQGR
jgi:DNA polymerase III delta prime subunit